MVFKKAGECLSYDIYIMALHQWQLLSLATYFHCFLNMLILEKGTKKNGKFYILSVFIYVVKCILFLCMNS